MRRLRFGAVSVAVLIVGILVPAMAGPAEAGGPTPLVVGIDNAPPSGHDWTYRDFFPREGIKVHNGDVLDFKWNTASPDGFHTATALKDGETPGDAWSTIYPQFVPDSDDGAGQLQLNPAVNFPSDPSCGGSASTPCNYDGSTDVNSGANGTAPGFDFFVSIDANAGTTINFVCLIHPGMATPVDVVDRATTSSTQDELDTASAAQHTADTAEGAAAEKAADTTQTKDNGDGTKTVSMTAGTSSAHVDVLEFLPNDVSINAGDTVKWATTGTEPHTITFPKGTNQGEPIQPVCEGDPDTPVTDPNGPPCGGDFSKFELHVDPAPSGATSIAAPDTFGTSGIILPSGSGAPVPDNYSFTFPSGGTFPYMCHIHEDMVGTVNVAASPTTTTAPGEAPRAEPVSATPTLTG